jgi:putative two-component system response regulator
MSTETGHILIVDDNEFNRDMLSRWLKRQGHTFVLAENGQQGLEIIDKTPDLDIILLDIMMPVMNGFQVLENLHANNILADIPVIVISAADDIEHIVRCVELGAEDYLFKPFNKVLLRARIEATLEKKHLRDQEKEHNRQIEEYNTRLETRVQEQVKEISSAQQATIAALAKISESRDVDTGKHIERVKEYCFQLLNEYSRRSNGSGPLPKKVIDNVTAASVLHDIGKVGIPDNILLKPGKLTSEEFEIMKTHSIIGSQTLREVLRQYPGNKFVQAGIEIAESHHEKWDGSGYPHQLCEENIPLSGRVLSLVDVYDALTSKRCYKEAISHEKSIEIIAEGRSQHFDPQIVECFLAVADDFNHIKTNLQDEF